MNNIAQSNPEGELERLGGVREFRGPDEPDRGGEELRGGASGSREGNDEKRSKKRLVILLVILGILAVAAVALIIWKPWEDGDNVVIEKEDLTVGQENEGADKNTVIMEKLALDDSLVQGLYEQVSLKNSAFNVYLDLWLELISSGEIKDNYMKYVALQNAEASATSCGITGRKAEIDGRTLEQPTWSKCVSGEVVRQKAQEIFGREITFVDGEDIGGKNADLGVYFGWIYDAKNDDFWKIEGGGGSVLGVSLDNALYRAEKDGERIYLYELIAYSCLVDTEMTGGSAACTYGAPGEEISNAELHWFRINYEAGITDEAWIGEDISEMTSLTLELEGEREDLRKEAVSQFLAQHADLVSQVKWAFVWNGENYVLEKVERIR